MALRFVYHSLTHKGMIRPDNQDNVYAGKLSRTAERYLFSVADGVGGREGGAWASQRALQALVQEMSTPGITLPTAIQTANQAVFQEAARNSARNGAATTLTAVLVENDSFIWANVGDSRTYLLRDEKCYQLSRDHSLVEEDLAAGRITKEEAESSNYRNVITRSIGNRPNVEVDCEGPFELDPGDVLLLCSDGLHQLVSSEEMRQELLEGTAESAAAALVDLANKRGGPDNISVVICATGAGTESRFRRGKQPSGTTQATRFIPREEFDAAPAVTPAPIAGAVFEEPELVEAELDDEPVAKAAMAEAPVVAEPVVAEPVADEPIAAPPVVEEPLEVEEPDAGIELQEPEASAPEPDPMEPATRARVLDEPPLFEPEPAEVEDVSTTRATPRIARLEPQPVEREAPPEPVRTPRREPVAAATSEPARAERSEPAPRPGRQEYDDEPSQNSGPGFRLIGFGIAVGATVGILIGLLRPF